MAEFAQQSMEEMLPELEQMNLVGLFTMFDIKQIMRRRRAFEYKMRKTVKEKRDYLLYIEHEKIVLNEVKKRRKVNKTTMKRKEIDISIVQRIHNLYKLACTRFSEDINLWRAHIAFSVSRNEMSTVGRLFSDVLKMHSHVPDLWISAAQWEMDTRLNMENARSLLQRGLRFNGKDKKLWNEYYRMELLNAEKLRLRREVLGLTEGVADLDEQMSAIHKGEVARIVYQNAIKELPSAEFCASFLPICADFPFAASQIEEIYNDLKTRFCNDEMAHAIVCKRPLLALESQDRTSINWTEDETRRVILETLRLFQEAVERLPSERMWDLYLETCIELLRKAKDDGIFTEVKELVGEIFEQALNLKTLSEKLSISWLKTLLLMGEVHYTLGLSARLCEYFPQSVLLWEIRLQMMVNMDLDSTDVWSEINTAIKRLAEDATIWKIAVEWCILRGNNQEAVGLFERGLKTKSACICAYIKASYLDYTATHEDIHSVRKLYKRLMGMPSVTLDLFHKYIAAELSQVKPKMKKIRRQYDFILTLFGSKDIDLWMKYIELEMKGDGGCPELVGQIYYRATKSLGEGLSNEFVTRYTRLINN